MTAAAHASTPECVKERVISGRKEGAVDDRLHADASVCVLSLPSSLSVVYLVVMNRLPAKHCSSHKEGTLSLCPSLFTSIYPSLFFSLLLLLVQAQTSIPFSSSSSIISFSPPPSPPLFTFSYYPVVSASLKTTGRLQEHLYSKRNNRKK